MAIFSYGFVPLRLRGRSDHLSTHHCQNPSFWLTKNLHKYWKKKAEEKNESYRERQKKEIKGKSEGNQKIALLLLKVKNDLIISFSGFY